MASRFAQLSETGDLKHETFLIEGGGVSNADTLAHVTISHALDNQLKVDFYSGHASSFVLSNFDVGTHCGFIHNADGVTISTGKARESIHREPRASCGAIVGCLANFSKSNLVHGRLRKAMGKKNFEFLSKHSLFLEDGKTDITALVAAALISIQSMIDIAKS